MRVRQLHVLASLFGLSVALHTALGWAEDVPATSLSSGDVVWMKSGVIYRGVITKRVPGVDVEMIMSDGTRKLFPWAEVEYAGPSAAMPGSPPTMPPAALPTAPPTPPPATPTPPPASLQSLPSPPKARVAARWRILGTHAQTQTRIAMPTIAGGTAFLDAKPGTLWTEADAHVMQRGEGDLSVPIDQVFVDSGTASEPGSRIDLEAVGLIDPSSHCHFIPNFMAGGRVTIPDTGLGRPAPSLDLGKATPDAPPTLTLSASPSHLCMVFAIPQNRPGPSTLHFGNASRALDVGTFGSLATSPAPGTTAPGPSSATGVQEPASPSPPDGRGPPGAKEYSRHRLQFAYLGGAAVQHHAVAAVSYTDNFGGSGTETIKASFGGGVGGSFTYGFALFEFLELTASYGAQWAGNDNGLVDVAKGGFLSFALLAGPQFNIPLYRYARHTGILLTLEGGASVYHSPSLDTNLSGITDGSDTVLSYAPALGWHAVAGLEFAARDVVKPGMGIGLRVGYYSVGYSLQSASRNGASVPTSSINQEFRNVSGDAVNASLYVTLFL